MAIRTYCGHDKFFFVCYNAALEKLTSLPSRPTVRQYRKWLRGKGIVYKYTIKTA